MVSAISAARHSNRSHRTGFFGSWCVEAGRSVKGWSVFSPHVPKPVVEAKLDFSVCGVVR